jgi:hypothetical protein
MNLRRSDISLDKIIHNDLFLYNKSGYGGKKIKKWPFYNFIKMWINGDCELARNLWIDWLVGEFKKYCIEEKFKGGMYQGSVHRYTMDYIKENKKKYWLDPSLINTLYINLGAAFLVDKRIELIKSILNNGYMIDPTDEIIAVIKDNFYELKGGHHRAAIMYALQREKLPSVIIYSKKIWELRKWMAKIKKFLN